MIINHLKINDNLEHSNINLQVISSSLLLYTISMFFSYFQQVFVNTFTVEYRPFSALFENGKHLTTIKCVCSNRMDEWFM